MNEEDKSPPGCSLRYRLQGHEGAIYRTAWSPDGKMLSLPSDDGTVQLWNMETGEIHLKHELNNGIYNVAWSPDSRTLAQGSPDGIILWDAETGALHKNLLLDSPQPIHSVIWSPDGKIIAAYYESTLQLWDVVTGHLLETFVGHTSLIRSIVWSPNGKVLASGSQDTTIRLWDVEAGEQLSHAFRGHIDTVRSLCWSPDGKLLVSGSDDRTIRLWEVETGQQKQSLEVHTDRVVCVSYSFDGRLLASMSHDGTVRLWRSDTWQPILVLQVSLPAGVGTGLAFHPYAPILATLGKSNEIIRIWDLDFAILLSTSYQSSSIHYTNAKVVLVGDSGVGKSGLGLVLSNQPFVPTDSTHGRRVWSFDHQEIELDIRQKEIRETLLWDLAGQPGYRLTHQLYLSEIAIALIIFDAHSETDPFAGVEYWDRALRLAQRIQGNPSPLKKFLVAARTDRGGAGVSQTRIKAQLQSLGTDRYFETSAKEGWNISELIEAIRNAIDWDTLPKITSTELFQHIKDFLVTEKESGRLLSTVDDLYRTFLSSKDASLEAENLRVQFETCIGLVESHGLIWRLSFGKFILLQPEVLDWYAAALVNGVKDEPDGLGSILEEKVKRADFPMPRHERLKDKEQEQLLLIAMVEDLLRHEIVLREPADGGPYLVFPSQITREKQDLQIPEGKAMTFHFEGPVLNIYATLAVRLSNSGMFSRRELWKNAVTFTTQFGGIYGMFLSKIDEGYGELTIFFDKKASREMRFHFENYIYTHLQRRALPESIRRYRIFECPECGVTFTNDQVRLRQERGFNYIRCSVCDTQVPLLDLQEPFASIRTSFISKIDNAADQQRERDIATSVVQGKRATNDFDVFLCYNKEDSTLVRKLGEQLKAKGILPWLDEWELRPGLPWQKVLELQIEQIKSVAVFIGKKGVGPWQRQEMDAFLREFVKRECPVIPVLLPSVPKVPKIPIFLNAMTWVDFRRRHPDPMDQLVWGITGKKE